MRWGSRGQCVGIKLYVIGRIKGIGIHRIE